MVARRHLEDAEAMALIRWRDLHARRHPELGLLIAIPNGGYRNAREAARLKRMGVRAGVSDYFLPCLNRGGPWPLKTKYGFWIELKAARPARSTTSGAQLNWLRAMDEHGYATLVCKGWVEAARTIADYLGLHKGVAP